MRIRSVKPEFWRSKTIADLSWDARLVLKGLESYVDDNGVGKYDLELIISDVFSRDHFRNPRETVARVSEAISEVISAGLVVRYEVDGEELLYIDKWKDIQRVDKPNAGRYRRPDGTLEYTEPVNRESYRKPREEVANPPEVLAPVTEEQGSRGTGETELAAQAPPTNTKRERGQYLPDNWQPAETTKQWARDNFGHLDLRAELEKFTNHWQASSGQNARKRNWDMAFRNWLHNARGPTTPNTQRIPASDAAFAQAQALKLVPDSRLELE